MAMTLRNCPPDIPARFAALRGILARNAQRYDRVHRALVLEPVSLEWDADDRRLIARYDDEILWYAEPLRAVHLYRLDTGLLTLIAGDGAVICATRLPVDVFSKLEARDVVATSTPERN
jgi:hypothetical protein